MPRKKTKTLKEKKTKKSKSPTVSTPKYKTRNSSPLSESPIDIFIHKNSITEVECIFADFTGSSRGKIMPAGKYRQDKNFRLPENVFFNTVTGQEPEDIENLVDADYSDMVLVPDISTLTLVPWAQDKTAGIIHDCIHQDGSNVDFAPRNVLKRVVDFYHKKGWEPIVAPEVEFFLTQIESSPHNPLSPPITRFQRPENGGGAYSMDTLNDFDQLFETLYAYCEGQNIEIDTLNHEYGTAQLEINFMHGPALKLADQVFRFKRTCREAAIRHNMYATFMAKPMEDQPGSAMHIHQSVVDIKTGQNIFVDKLGNFNSNFYNFIGGMQKYIPLLMLFFSPNVNSYRRFVPDWSAPVDVEWGMDNRNVGLRVPISTPKNTRVENRVAGVDTNPYLALAASLVSGYLGIVEQIEPRPVVEGKKYAKGTFLPRSLEEAISELDVPNEAHNILGKRFVRAYKAVKKCELDEYTKVISSWERKYLLLSV